MDDPAPSTPSAHQRLDMLLAKRLAATFGGKPKVTRYWDEPHASAVDVLVCTDAPQEAVSSYATVSLSDHPILRDGRPTGVRAEVVGACGSDFAGFVNVVATCAFNVINSKLPIALGIVHKDVVAMYRRGGAMRHILFHNPFLWHELGAMQLPSKTVAFVLAVPISDAEARFLHEKGYDALADRFEAEQIDVFDIDRASIL